MVKIIDQRQKCETEEKETETEERRKKEPVQGNKIEINKWN